MELREISREEHEEIFNLFIIELIFDSCYVEREPIEWHDYWFFTEFSGIFKALKAVLPVNEIVINSWDISDYVIRSNYIQEV